MRELVDAFVTAWERADVAALLDLLADDAQFTMPPLPAWFHGREDVGRFLAERVFATPWRLLPLRVNGQLGFACYSLESDAVRFKLGAINLLRLRAGRIAEITGFLDPDVHRQFRCARRTARRRSSRGPMSSVRHQVLGSGTRQDLRIEAGDRQAGVSNVRVDEQGARAGAGSS